MCFCVLLLHLGKACDGFRDIWRDKQQMSVCRFSFEVSAACKPSFVLRNGPWIILYLISISKPFCFSSHSTTLPCITLFRVSRRKEIDVWHGDFSLLNIYNRCCSVLCYFHRFFTLVFVLLWLKVQRITPPHYTVLYKVTDINRKTCRLH